MCIRLVLSPWPLKASLLYVLLEGDQGGPGIADTNGQGGPVFRSLNGPVGPFIPETDGPRGTNNEGDCQ